jgi:hypothetical protein
MDFQTPFWLKKVGLGSNNEGVPKVTITLEVEGRGVMDLIDFGELSSMTGKNVAVTIRDLQLRLATNG